MRGSSEQGKSLAAVIDHTLLKPTAGSKEVAKWCEEALAYQFASVCVHGRWVPLCAQLLQGKVAVAAVCGFPHGAMSTENKVDEANWAAANGAVEIDMVASLADLADGRYDAVTRDIEAVVRAVAGQALVKVILETGYFEDEVLRKGCDAAMDAGAAFVKTCTGFGPGQAEEAHIRLFRDVVGDRMLIKASGGIRDADTAKRMLAAGADRIGASASLQIIGTG